MWSVGNRSSCSQSLNLIEWWWSPNWLTSVPFTCCLPGSSVVALNTTEVGYPQLHVEVDESWWTQSLDRSTQSWRTTPCWSRSWGSRRSKHEVQIWTYCRVPEVPRDVASRREVEVLQGEVLVQNFGPRSLKFLFEVLLWIPPQPEVTVRLLHTLNSKLRILNESGPFQLKLFTRLHKYWSAVLPKLQKVRNHPWSQKIYK